MNALYSLIFKIKTANRSYLRLHGCEVNLGDPEVESLETDVLLELVSLVVEGRLEAPRK